MKISAPAYTQTDSFARVSSTFTFSNGEQHEIFFETTPEFGQYLVHEVADAFIISALLPALVNGEDIYVDRVSSSVRYNFDALMYLFGKIFSYSPIKLHAEEVLDINFEPKAVGTGFSGGVDSLLTYLEHTSDECPENLRVDHLALFNVGAYGNDPVKTSKNFHEDLERAKKFSNQVNIPLVPLNSNLSSIYTHKDIFHYSLRIELCLSAGILSLQKLFRQYYISSSYTIEQTRLHKHSQTHYESLISQRLSTANTNIMISEVHYNRVEKTKKILASDLTAQHLYVCNADLMNEKWGEHNEKEGYLNCSECFKCVRTLLTIDILGKLDQFGNLFNLEKYKKQKDQLILNMYQLRHKDPFQKEIYELFIETNSQFTPSQLKLIKAWERKQLPHRILRKVRSVLGKIKHKIFK